MGLSIGDQINRASPYPHVLHPTIELHIPTGNHQDSSFCQGFISFYPEISEFCQINSPSTSVVQSTDTSSSNLGVFLFPLPAAISSLVSS